MENAKRISDESNTGGCICCPGSEQWFVFTAARTGRYTILTTGSSDTVGTLYDCCGNQLAEVDDYAPCGKINFRIVCNLTAGATYYVKVRLYGSSTGSYVLRVTEQVFADYVTVSKDSVTLDYGVTYELPITPNYTYRGYNGAKRISGLSVSVSPSYADEKKVWWYAQDSDILSTSTGWDNAGNRYIHITAKKSGTTKLFAEAWNENGKRDECIVNVKGKPVTGVTLDFTSKIMHIGDVDYLNEEISPSNADNKQVNWSSSNTSVAEVNSAGKVTTKSVGTTIITVRTDDGGYTAQCTVSVVEGIIVEKTADSNGDEYSRIVFPNGKVWKCMNFDIINGYALNQNEPVSQRFYDNVYETKVEDGDYTYYYEPIKEYTDDELKIIYMIDPHGMAAYVREYADNLPETGDSLQESTAKKLAYKDRIFKMLFNRDPDYYARTMDLQWYITSSRGDLSKLFSESESLFGTHTVYDMATLSELITVLLDVISMGIQCPALKKFENFVKIASNLIKYFSLVRSVGQSVLSSDFNGFLEAVVSGLDEDALNDEIVLSNTTFKSKNYTLGWAFEIISLGSDLGALADTFNAGPHFYKEVFTQCSNDTDYDVYLRMEDGNLVSVSELAGILN